MTREGEITAIVPVRAGSQRVSRKSMRKFADTNLLTLKIETLQKVKNLDNIVVTSDSDSVLELANKLGAKTHKREKYYASSECPASEFFEHLAQKIEGVHYLYSPPTAPFVRVGTVFDAIETYLKMDTSYDSLASVSLVKDHMWFAGAPLNYTLFNSPNSQDLPEIVRITYGINLVSRLDMLKNRNVVGKTPMFLPLKDNQSIDIDTMLDFNFAEFVYRQENNV